MDKKLSNKIYYKKNREKILIKCKEYYHKTKEKFREIKNKRSKQYAITLRLDVMNHYGNKCKCCGESHIDFLSIDHINNDGYKNRNKQGTGVKFYRWIIKNNYPNDLQILCYNCNQAKQYVGICPHTKEYGK